MTTHTSLFEGYRKPRFALWVGRVTRRARERRFVFREVLFGMCQMIKNDPRAALVWPVAEGWVSVGQRPELCLVASVALLVGKEQHVMILTMVFLVADGTSDRRADFRSLAGTSQFPGGGLRAFRQRILIHGVSAQRVSRIELLVVTRHAELPLGRLRGGSARDRRQ
jgi:hypothetical protein